MAAIEFAVKYDDGAGAAGLREADIVLVGVSRTSKTPLSMYLGYLGYKTANVPIVKGIEPPEELFEIDPAKIVGLTIDAERLAEIRRERARLMQALSASTTPGSSRSTRSSTRPQRDPPPARLPRDRRHGALGRGDRSAHRPPRRAPQPRAPGEPLVTDAFYDPARSSARARRIPSGAGRSGTLLSRSPWSLFYVLLTPLWLGLRGAPGWPSSEPGAGSLIRIRAGS